jgi:hypothetical protein
MPLETQTPTRREPLVNARMVAPALVGLGVASIPRKAEVQGWVQALQA